MCINKTEFPNIGPIFSIMAGIICVMILLSKKFYKKETEVVPSAVAFVSCI